MNQRSRLWFRAIFCIASAVVVAACTFLGSRDVVQCRQNSDCSVSTLQRPVCSQGLCVSGPVVDANPTPTTDSGVDADIDASGVECNATPDCPFVVGQQKLCVNNRCVRMTDPTAPHGCDTIYPTTEDYKNPNAIIIGVYTTIGSGITDQGGPGAVVHAINQMGKSPPIIAVMCRKDKERRRPDLAIEHMAALKIPLLIGQFETAELSNIALLAKDKNVVVWSTLGSATAENVFLVQDRLATTVAGFQAAFDLMEGRTNPNTGDASRPPTKVAVLHGSVEDTGELLNALQSPDGGLIVNGQPLAESGPVGAEIVKFYPAAANGVIPVTPIYSAQRPNIVIGIGGDNITDAIGTIEGNWGGDPRPQYIVSARSRYNVVEQSFMQGNKGDVERARILGVDFAGDGNKHQNIYALEIEQDRAAAFDVLYDATWVAALSFLVPVEGASSPRSASDIIRAFDTFRDPSAVTAISPGGTVEFLNASTAVGSGAHVKFTGVSGLWAFEGNARRNPGHSFFCFPTGSNKARYYNGTPAATGCQQP